MIKLIYNKEVLLETKVSPKKDAITTFRYVKSSTSKSKEGVNIETLLLEKMGITLPSCAFCNEPTAILFDVILEDNCNLIVQGAKYYSIAGYQQNHCRRGRKICPGSLLNPNSKEYIMKACNISEQTAIDIIHNRNSSPFYRNNHNSEKEYKESQQRDLKWYKKKYGEKGEELFKKRNDKIKKHSTYEYFCLKYGKEAADRIISKKVNSLKNMIDRYGDSIGLEKYKLWVKNVSNTIERFIERYGQEDGINRYSSFVEKARYRNTVQYYIDRFGYDIGLEKYKEWIKRSTWTKEQYIAKHGIESWLNRLSNINNNISSTSKESERFFAKLLNALSDIVFDEVLYGTKNEYYQYDYTNKKIYFYDLFLKINNVKIIVEYDTPFCHPSKNLMSPEEYDNWKFPFNEMTAKEKEEYDEQKKNIAKKNGHIVLTAYIKDGNELNVITNISETIKMYAK